MPNIVYIIEIAIGLGLLILVHELGHFLAARKFGVLVRRFAIFLGPPIVKWKRGETEYSIRAIPFGGFVDMPGEQPDDEAKDDPRALCNKPVWQRAIVFSSGVAMNLALAVVLFAVAPMLGIQAQTPVIGTVVPGLPAEKAGLEVLDRIVAVNGEPVQSFLDVRMIISLTDADDEVSVTVERAIEGATEPKRITRTMRTEAGSFAPVIGIEPLASTRVFQVIPGSHAAQAGLERGDRVLRVNGKPTETWLEVEKQLKDKPSGPVDLTVERGGEDHVLTVRPDELATYEFGMLPPTLVAGVERNSPAEAAGVRQGDWILKADGFEWPTTDELKESVQKAGPGGEVTLHLFRKGWLFWPDRTIDVACKVARLGDDRQPRIGVALGYVIGPPLLVAGVEPDGPAAAAGFHRGDRILALLEKPVKPDDWEDVYRRLREAAVENPVPVVVERGGAEQTLLYQVGATPPERVSLDGVVSEPLYVRLPRVTNPLSAIRRGFRQAYLWVLRSYGNLKQLLRQQIKPTAVGGPVSIVAGSLEMASKGIGTLMEFWAMIGVFVAVLNFLPLPPFDGGHVLFLAIEKIKGSPVGMKVRNFIWTVAWIGILLLFVLITWQDIARIYEIYFRQ